MTIDSVVDEWEEATAKEYTHWREHIYTLKSMLKAEVEKMIDEAMSFDNTKLTSLLWMHIRNSLLGGADKDDDSLSRGKSVIKNGIAHNSPVLTSETPSEKKEAK